MKNINTSKSLSGIAIVGLLLLDLSTAHSFGSGNNSNSNVPGGNNSNINVPLPSPPFIGGFIPVPSRGESPPPPSDPLPPPVSDSRPAPAPASASEPETEKPKPVLESPAKVRVRFQLRVLFDSDSAKIKPEYLQHLQDLANFLKTHPGATIDLVGHADSTTTRYDARASRPLPGNKQSRAGNDPLSKDRAEAIRRHLIKLGVNPAQLTASFSADGKPAGDNSTKEGRALNRRVVGVAEAEQNGDEAALQGFLGSIQ